MGFCSLRRASLFAFCEEVGKAVGRAGVHGPLTPWKLPGDLLWFSSSSGLCSTSQRASHLGSRMHGYGEGQALPRCWSIRVCMGFAVGWCLVEGSLSSSRFNDPERCSNARAISQNVILCTNKVSQVPWPLCSPAGRREDDARAGPSVPPCRAPFGSRPAGMLPASLPEEVMSGSEVGQPAGSHKTQTRCSCEPDPQHGHRELGVVVLLSSLWDKPSCLHLARSRGGDRKSVV